MRREYVHDYILPGNEHREPGTFFLAPGTDQYVIFQLPGCEVRYNKTLNKNKACYSHLLQVLRL